MIKVLILAYDYPPYVSVGGLRPYSWQRYMNEFGAFPVVITRQWSNRYGSHLDYIAAGESEETIVESSEKSSVFKTPYKPNFSNRLMLKYGDSKYRLLRRIISSFYEFGQYLFVIGPKKNLYNEAEKYLSENKTDLIIATGEPYVLFSYASKLSEKFGIPWIADYRDPWTQDKKRREVGIPEFWDAFVEKRTLASVSAITTVSRFFQRKIETLIKDKSIFIVPNGYDPDAIDSVKEIKQSAEKLSIGFVGTIYKWHPVESFLRVCSSFVGSFENAPHFEINFYGINAADEIRELLETNFQNLKPVVNIYPKLPNGELLEKLAADNVFLLFNYYSYMGTKIYDYLALKRRILLCYGNDEETNLLKAKYYNMDEPNTKTEHLQQQVIKETNSGVIIENAAHLRTVLDELYSEFQEKKSIACDSVDTNQYSRKIQVGNLVKVFEKIIANGK